MSVSVLPNEKPTRTLSEFEFLHAPESKEARLGKGSFAQVKLIKEKASGQLMALKAVDVELKKASKSDMHNLRMEIQVHRELDHPNIIKFHTYLIEEERVYLVLDYAPKGNLYSYMHKNKNLPSELVFRFFHQTCLAINYLHQKDILHRDIKPENLLLDKDLNIKLCDFGWAARSIKDKRTTFCGTYEYMAPEVVNKSTYNYKVDVWSLGILLYELFHNEAPYKGRSLDDIKVSIARETIHFNPVIQPDMKDLILRILHRDPEQRLEISDILNHAWVRKNIAKFNPPARTISNNENQQPGQQQPQSPQFLRAQSSPNVKDQKYKIFSSPRKAEETNSNGVVIMSSFGLLKKQMSESREAASKTIKEPLNLSKDTVIQGYMTPAHKGQLTPNIKDLNRPAIKFSSPLADRTASGLSLLSSQKNNSEGHPVQFQNDINKSKNVNLRLGKAVKNGTKGSENEGDFTPVKQQSHQYEQRVKSPVPKSPLVRKPSEQDYSIAKENTLEISPRGFSKTIVFNTPGHPFTTTNTGSSAYENFTQAISSSQRYKSPPKLETYVKQTAGGNVTREALSATTKVHSTRLDQSSDSQRNGNKANFGGKLKRDGVKINTDKFYPFGAAGSNTSTNTPSQTSFESNSAGINGNRVQWEQQSRKASSPYVFTRADSDNRLNYTSNNSLYGGFPGNSPYAFGQGPQNVIRVINSPLAERHMGGDMRTPNAGYKINRSNTMNFI